MRKIILAMFVSLGFFILFSCGDGEMPDDSSPVTAKVITAGAVSNSEDVDFDYEHVRGFKVIFSGGVREGQITLYSNETASADTDFASLPFDDITIDECGYDIKWDWRSTDCWKGLPMYFSFNRNVDFTKLGIVALTYAAKAPDYNYPYFVITLVDKDGNETEADSNKQPYIKIDDIEKY